MTGAILKVEGGGYMVPSRSVSGAWRFVHGKHCSCPAGGARTCRHRRAVAAFCADQDHKFVRPTAPPHVAALCD